MNYLPLMTDDEIKYICSVIHPQSVSIYFQRRPKEFAKVFPGFRPNTMSRFNIPDLLFRYRNRGFISSFIEDNISHWLPEIKECLDQCIEEGASKNAAYIQILPQSFFAGNIPLYFKLIEEEHPEDYIAILSSAVMETKKMSEEQEKLKEEAKLHETTIEQLQSKLKPLRPIDIDEFKEYLGYNLKDIGISTPPDCLLLLKQHLCDILFHGMPIIISRGTGVQLMKCVANTLIGDANVVTLTYNKDISTQEIEAFLSENVRVVCLDGFLGNYSETELLALLERYRNKIIFLTLAYDRTLRFIPYEIFRYCHYLNLNRIQALSVSGDLTEDPSTFEETEADIPKTNQDTRYASLLKEILNEFGLAQGLVTHKCAHVSNEQDLCSLLAFDILPYCADVLQIAPFVVSERLDKYAGDRGRCSYKNLFKEWFA